MNASELVAARFHLDPRDVEEIADVMSWLPRFLSKIHAPNAYTCWMWTGTVSGTYGVFHRNGMACLAHRVAHEWWKGPIPDGQQVDHLCRVRLCVNPLHLEAVSPRENQHRGESPSGRNARKTHCHRGHLLDEENTYVSRRGFRSCRECARTRWREYAARKKEGAR